jgi:hypothetical protein
MARVVINISAYIPPPAYNAVQLAFYPTSSVCDKTTNPYQISNESFTVESLIYNEDNSVASTGWYSDGVNKGFWDGVILSQLGSCASLPPMTTYNYEGIYESGDDRHPNGGSLNYVDVNGATQSLTFMFSGTCVSFESQSAPSNKVGVATCVPQ